ncbi:HrgA protein, partial [Campylobacter jejuni]|nr:HrgA protein [Campylobacter jejuni]
MSGKLTYKELIIEVLKQTKKPLNVSEIWQKALEKGLDKKLSS